MLAGLQAAVCHAEVAFAGMQGAVRPAGIGFAGRKAAVLAGGSGLAVLQKSVGAAVSDLAGRLEGRQRAERLGREHTNNPLVAWPRRAENLT